MANIVRRHGTEPQPQRRAGMAQPFDPMRIFRDLLRWDPFAEMMPAPVESQFAAFVPDFEIRETKDAYVFKADLPGVSEDDLEIDLAGNRLTISGKREAESRDESDRYYAYERSYGSFSRSFTLPEQVDSDKVNAALDNGVLTVSVPKRPEAQPKKISVGAKQQGGAQPGMQAPAPTTKEKPKA